MGPNMGFTTGFTPFLDFEMEDFTRIYFLGARASNNCGNCAHFLLHYLLGQSCHRVN